MVKDSFMRMVFVNFLKFDNGEEDSLKCKDMLLIRLLIKLI